MSVVDEDRVQRPSSSAPPLDEQVRVVLETRNAPLEENDVGYVLSSKWLARVFARTTELRDSGAFDKSALEGEIGPVDNYDLVFDDWTGKTLVDLYGRTFVPLKPNLRMGEELEIVPERAWELIKSWYGVKEGRPTITRYVRNTSTGSSSNLEYELYPPVFTIRKTRDSASISQSHAKRAPKIVASRATLFQSFLKEAKRVAEIGVAIKVKVWRVVEPAAAPTDSIEKSRSGMLTPDTSRSNSPEGCSSEDLGLTLDLDRFAHFAEPTQRERIDVNDETANPKYNGGLSLGTVGLSTDQTLVLEPRVGGPAGGEFLTDSVQRLAKVSNAGPVVTNDGKSYKKNTTQTATQSGRSSPAPPGPVTRGRVRKDGRMRGTVGLTNLGNTCYMNSALQCIRSVEEMSLYFLQGKYKEDINPENPIGYGGAIAKTYAGFLASVYDDHAPSFFTPKNFKFAVGKYAPAFSGYGQQDSQEFLSFLVDGLHEDLNRIVNKPYKENPESDDKTVHDPEAIRQLGETFRANYRARNDSIAMDLFSGFYKNTVVCPECDKVSITFDPYSLLTVQLPIEQTWQHTVFFAPLRGPPIQVNVDMDKNATIRAMKEFVAKRFPGLTAERLMAAEVYGHKFFRTYDDRKTIVEANIQPRDDVVFYELDAPPTNFPPPKKKQGKSRSTMWNASSDEEIPETDSPFADRMAVPVFHRAPTSSSYLSASRTLKSWPSFVLITRKEATSYDLILKKVLARVATMTSKDILIEDDAFGSTSTSQNDSDAVITTEEDASSNADPNVHTASVEGEDNMVDVSISHPPTKRDNGDQNLERTNSDTSSKSIPGVLRPGTFIPGSLQNLFEMKYFKSKGEMIPTGWNAIDSNKEYPTVRSREPTRIIRESSTLSHGSGQSNSTSSEDPEDNIEFSNQASLSLNNAPDTDEESPPSVHAVVHQQNTKNARKHNRRKNKTYTARAKRAIGKPASTPPLEGDDDPALIRIGEALILDWSPEAYDALFEGSSGGDDLRGCETWKLMDTLSDPELEEKKATRAARKRSGVTLEDCFAETAKGEILSEGNAWYCNRCKEMRLASKKLEIWTAPDILVVHLKRFSAHRTFRDKIDVLVDFPVEGLDLTGRVGLNEGKSLVYDLFAVDNHYGGLGGGHYTAFAQNFFDKKWYEYNDSQVTPRNSSQLVTSAAYLLFYRRRSSIPLGPPYLRQMVQDYYNPPEPSSESSSRASSPAGKGQRLDGSSPNGSSSTLAGAGAAHQRGGGGDSGTAPQNGSDEETLPEYSFDEGIEMDEEVGYGVTGPIGPLNYNQTTGSSWSLNGFDAIGVSDDKNDGSDDAFEDANSDEPVHGSDAGDDRMMTDFGDDILNPGQVSPENVPFPDLVSEPVPTISFGSGNEDADASVAEVRVDDNKGDVKVD
ncbi:hypothetical protein BDY21DRAFT_287701 [Lineolata rhizophorae]|uniref:ubiquitinyl hydrolase 1 n=1 Tax=Lineolata rhizophorae TaxID=578093 RepID=A0A6A6NXB8_9PEZI|nr:hypothetical protein BDY21DRAFT_287701 [Lineolata rhizophorae]